MLVQLSDLRNIFLRRRKNTLSRGIANPEIEKTEVKETTNSIINNELV
jgi:hypothetical protein